LSPGRVRTVREWRNRLVLNFFSVDGVTVFTNFEKQSERSMSKGIRDNARVGFLEELFVRHPDLFEAFMELLLTVTESNLKATSHQIRPGDYGLPHHGLTLDQGASTFTCRDRSLCYHATYITRHQNPDSPGGC
jgi:hypothetical protein